MGFNDFFCVIVFPTTLLFDHMADINFIIGERSELMLFEIPNTTSFVMS